MVMVVTRRRDIIVNNFGPAMSKGKSMEYLHRKNIVRPIHRAHIQRIRVQLTKMRICDDARSLQRR